MWRERDEVRVEALAVVVVVPDAAVETLFPNRQPDVFELLLPVEHQVDPRQVILPGLKLEPVLLVWPAAVVQVFDLELGNVRGKMPWNSARKGRMGAHRGSVILDPAHFGLHFEQRLAGNPLSAAYASRRATLSAPMYR